MKPYFVDQLIKMMEFKEIQNETIIFDADKLLFKVWTEEN